MLLICVACGDEFKEVTPEGPITTPSIHDEIFEKIAPLLKDTTGFDRETMGGTGNALSYVKDGKLWIGLFSDQNFTALEKEWLSSFYVPEGTKRIILSTYTPETDITQTSNGYTCFIIFHNSKEPANYTALASYCLNLLDDGTIRILYQFDDIDNIFHIDCTAYGNNYFLLSFDTYRTESSGGNEKYLLSDGEIIATNVTVTYEGNSYFFTGWQNDKLRVDVYDESTKETNNWISETAFDKTLSVHQGYGEYITHKIDSVRLSNVLSLDWGYVGSLTYRTDKGIVNKDLLILNNQGDIILKELENNSYISYRGWYNNSFLIQDSNIWTVISPDGEEILNVEDDYFYSINHLEPISYDELIKIKDSYSNEWTISRYNLRNQTTRWETKLDVLSANMESDAKLSATIHKNGNIWQYQCDILYYDGSTRQVSFTINIETGELL